MANELRWADGLFKVVEGRRMWIEPSRSVQRNLELDGFAKARERGTWGTAWEEGSDRRSDAS